MRAGHLWIYANEIDTRRSPLTDYAAGERVFLIASNGANLGEGYINPHSLIAARLLTRGKTPFTPDLLKTRLKQALDLRDALYPDQCYRWVHAEGDFLPGLVIDRYRDTVVIQSNTAGIDVMLDDITSVIDTLVSPDVIAIRSDSDIRKLEALEPQHTLAKGQLSNTVKLVENGNEFEFAFDQIQKTGWFFDQRDNRRTLNSLVEGKSILDAYCYFGGYAIQALNAGASHATLIDASESALNNATSNAQHHGVEQHCTFYKDDGLKRLKQLRSDEQSYDVVVVDPPAFIRRRKSIREGLTAYQRLNEAAISLVKPGGLLVTSTCSYHASRDDFLSSVRRACVKRDRLAQIIYEGGQAADHPRHPAMPETRYLKTFFMRLM